MSLTEEQKADILNSLAAEKDALDSIKAQQEYEAEKTAFIMSLPQDLTGDELRKVAVSVQKMIAETADLIKKGEIDASTITNTI